MPQEIKGYSRPPQEMPSYLLERGEAKEVKAPLMISLFTWLCFLRAALYFLLAFILWSYPDSDFTNYLVAHSDLIIKRTAKSRGIYGGPEETTVREFLLAASVFFGVMYSGLMFITGATAIKTAVYMTADEVGGSSPFFNDIQRAGLVISIGLNLLICGYLAFYPGVEQAFKENSWE